MVDYKNRENGIKERLNQLLSKFGITQNRVAAGDSAAQKRINSQLKADDNTARLSVDTLLRVMDAVPTASPEWIIKGTGSMCEQETPSQINYGANGFINSGNVTGLSENVLLDALVNQLAIKDKQIAELTAALNSLSK